MEKDKCIREQTQDKFIGETWKSATYMKTTGCGNIYITLAYSKDKPRKIEFIRISGEKHNNCGASFNEALADMTTFAIRRIRNSHEALAIVKNLLYHRCNNIKPNKDHINSCPDALGQVLKKVLIEDYEKNNISTQKPKR